MAEKIIRDYLAGFGWGRIREKYKNSGWFLYLYILSAVPMIILGKDDGGKLGARDVLCYYLTCIPMLFGMFSLGLHSMTLPKILYLCPMDERERKAYVKGAYRLKIAIPVGIAVVFCTILFGAGMLDGFLAVMVVAETLLLCCTLGIDAGAAGRWTNGGNRKQQIPGMEAWTAGATIYGMCVGVFMMFTVWQRGWVRWEKLLLLAAVAIQLPLTLKVMSFYPKAVQNVLCYENKVGQTGRTENV